MRHSESDGDYKTSRAMTRYVSLRNYACAASLVRPLFIRTEARSFTHDERGQI